MVARLLAKSSRNGPRPQAVEQPGLLGKQEWLLSDLTRCLQMPQATLHRFACVGCRFKFQFPRHRMNSLQKVSAII